MRASAAVFSCMLVGAGCSLISKTDPSRLTADSDAGSCGGAVESCGNCTDDDCDTMIDEGCSNAIGEVCASPQPLGAAEELMFNTCSFIDDETTSCGVDDAGAPDMVFSVTLSDVRDFEVRTSGSDFDTIIALRSACDDAASELSCSNNANSTGTSRVIHRALPAAMYYVIVEGDTTATTGNLVVTSSATSPPAQRTCNNPLDISGGAVINGSFTDAMDDHERGSCGGDESPEEVFVFTLDSPASITVFARNTSARVIYIRRGTCDDDNGGEGNDEEIACVTGEVGSERIEATLDAGSYYLFLDGDSDDVVGSPYELVVFFGEP